jgi:hypothetical protein
MGVRAEISAGNAQPLRRNRTAKLQASDDFDQDVQEPDLIGLAQI